MRRLPQRCRILARRRLRLKPTLRRRAPEGCGSSLYLAETIYPARAACYVPGATCSVLRAHVRRARCDVPRATCWLLAAQMGEDEALYGDRGDRRVFQKLLAAGDE